MITSPRAGLADRLVVAIAPRVMGSGTDAVNDLGITEVASAIRLERRAVHVAGDDVLIAGDVAAWAFRPLADRGPQPPRRR